MDVQIKVSILGEGDSPNVKVQIDENGRRLVDADYKPMSEDEQQIFCEKLQEVLNNIVKQSSPQKILNLHEQLKSLDWTIGGRR